MAVWRAAAAAIFLLLCLSATTPNALEPSNLIHNGDFETKDSGGKPLGFVLNGDVEYRFLGDPRLVYSSFGVALQSGRRPGSAGEVSTVVSNIDSAQGRWFRFAFRGLPEANFSVGSGDLYIRVEFFGKNGQVSYDAKSKNIYDQVQEDRKNMTANGVRHVGGAEVWRTYQLDFMLPFPQVDQVRIAVGFGRGAATTALSSEFFVDDFTLVRIPGPADEPGPATRPLALVPAGEMIPIAGRWFYLAREGETTPPALFDDSNADRLIYHDNVYSAPFAGNMTAWLHAGDKDSAGNVVGTDRFVRDNVTVSFDATSMIIHTHGLPNHPTGRFPALGFGPGANPNFIQDRLRTYYIPLNPQPNPRHFVTTRDNSNHALPMGPIGVAVNGVVFFNPFDADSQDATDLMDLCCGHPAPDNQYHYHKYPICINSPWADDGKGPSPLIGWAFDGYPIYGPYQIKDVMAKDVTGPDALNDFNGHSDADRGFHFNVTPGKFPYIIGGYWGTEDPRDAQQGRGGMAGRGAGGPGGQGGRGAGGPGGPGGFGPNGPGPGGRRGPPRPAGFSVES